MIAQEYDSNRGRVARELTLSGSRFWTDSITSSFASPDCSSDALLPFLFLLEDCACVKGFCRELTASAALTACITTRRAENEQDEDKRGLRRRDLCFQSLDLYHELCVEFNDGLGCSSQRGVAATRGGTGEGKEMKPIVNKPVAACAVESRHGTCSK